MESLNKSYNLWVIAFSILIICMYFPALYHDLSQIDPNHITPDDATQYIPPFYKYMPDNIPTTYTDEYYLDALIPTGYKALFTLIAKYFDPLYVCRWLPFVFFVLTTALIGFCVRSVSGTLVALSSVMFTISFTAVFMFAFAFGGGAPRAFGFPIIVLTLIGLVQCRPYLLASVTIIATMFYPTVAVISGFSMSLMLILPATYREPIEDWSLKKRLFFIFATAFISAICLMPQFLSAIEYGSRITTQTLGLFPEAGKDGINQIMDQLPFEYDIMKWLKNYFLHIFTLHYDYLTDFYTLGMSFHFRVLLIIVVLICIHFCLKRIVKKENTKIFRSLLLIIFGVFLFFASELLPLNTYIDERTYPDLRVMVAIFVFFSIILGLMQVTKKENAKVFRSLLLLVSGLCLFFLATILQPYLYMPKRYLVFTIPIIVTFLFPVATIMLLNSFSRINSRKGLAEKITVIISFVIVILVGGNGRATIAVGSVWYNSTTDDVYKTIEKISQLEKNALIAGWPSDKVVETTKLYAKRNIFITAARHQALHEKHTLEMRHRMNMLIKAYYATDVKDIIPLSQEYGVTHILINKVHFEEKNPPSYIEPFKKDILEIQTAQRNNSLLKDTNKLKEAIIFEQDSYIMYDLNKIIEILQVEKYDQ